MKEFKQPSSLGEARRRKGRLEIEQEEIKLQLTDRDRRDENGGRMNPLDYIAWRKSAKWSLLQKEAEAKDMGFWIEDYWEERGASDTEDIVEALLAVISALAEESGGLTKAESLLVNKAKGLMGDENGDPR
jgi:hypothetical protein